MQIQNVLLVFHVRKKFTSHVLVCGAIVLATVLASVAVVPVAHSKLCQSKIAADFL